MIYALVFLLIAGGVGYWLNKKGLRMIAEKHATKELEKMLFPGGMAQQKQIIQTVHEITNSRLTDEEALDYFLKIKGLQVINLNDPINYWTRKYLMSSTKIRLNYFEQVKFYETFLNFPEVNGRVFKKVDLSPLSRFPLTQAAQELIKNTTLAKKLA